MGEWGRLHARNRDALWSTIGTAAELRRLLGVRQRDRAPGLKAPRKALAGLTDFDAIEAPWIAAGLDWQVRR